MFSFHVAAVELQYMPTGRPCHLTLMLSL